MSRKSPGSLGKVAQKPRKQLDANVGDRYDFRDGVRGKHAAQSAAASNVVRLDDDVAVVYQTPESVNAALRVLARLVKALADEVPA